MGRNVQAMTPAKDRPDRAPNISKSQQYVLTCLRSGGELGMARMLGDFAEHELDHSSAYGYPFRHCCIIEAGSERYAVGLRTVEALMRRGWITNGANDCYIITDEGREALALYELARVVGS